MQSDATAVCQNTPNAPDALNFMADDTPGFFDLSSLLAETTDADLEPLMTILSQILSPDDLAHLLAGDFSQVGAAAPELTDNAELAGDGAIEIVISGKSFFLGFDAGFHDA